MTLQKLLNIYTFICERIPYQLVPASSVIKDHTLVLFAVVVQPPVPAGGVVFPCHFTDAGQFIVEAVTPGFVRYKTKLKAPEDGIPVVLNEKVTALFGNVPYCTLPFEIVIDGVEPEIDPKLYANSV